MYNPTTEDLERLAVDLSDLEILAETDSKRVSIDPCVEKYTVFQHECYNNIFDIMLRVHGAIYVVGVAARRGVTFCHAWLKIGDKYYDPTLEFGETGVAEEYYVMAELDRPRLGRCTLLNNDCPPSAEFITTRTPEYLCEL